jgi:hypothetical protein
MQFLRGLQKKLLPEPAEQQAQLEQLERLDGLRLVAGRNR